MNNPFPLPSAFIQHTKMLLKDDSEAFLKTYHKPPYRGIRFRYEKPCLGRDDLGDKIIYAKNAWYLSSQSSAGNDPLHESGAYYIQEPSAMAACAVLAPSEGDRILDLCAAPGGKSTQIAMSAELSLLVSNEPNPSRAHILSGNIERMGIKNAIVTCAFPQQLSDKWPMFFDKILVDAPCSGEGMFRKNPSACSEWTADLPIYCHHRQTEILDHAALMLRPGGKIVYSTCTFNTIENEQTIAVFLDKHKNFQLKPISVPGLPSAPDGMMRLWPHRFHGEGHFIALLQKESPLSSEKKPASPVPIPEPNHEIYRAFQDFSKETGCSFPVLSCWKSLLISPPRISPATDNINVLRMGLHIGALKGHIFSPDHALPMSVSLSKCLELTRRDIILYLHGDTIPCASDLRGFYAVSYKGFQFGLVKASDGIMKNHYPKGLRKTFHESH